MHNPKTRLSIAKSNNGDKCSSSTTYYQQVGSQQFAKCFIFLKMWSHCWKYPQYTTEKLKKSSWNWRRSMFISSLDPTKPTVRVRSSPLQNLSLHKSGSQQRKQTSNAKKIAQATFATTNPYYSHLSPS